MKHLLSILVACSVLSGFAAQRTVDEATALQLVKSQRNLTTADTANFYIGTVTNYINERYCPVDEALASQQKWLVSSQDKWLVFANEEPLMTWTHNCTYYYVPKSYDDNGPAPVFAVKGTLPPLKERLTLIERNVSQPSYNGKKPIMGSMASINETINNPYAKKIRAILVTTGTGENTKGRYDACANTYKMLTGLYGIPKENISLFIDDNNSANLDDGEGQLSHDIDGDGINEVIAQPTKKNILSSATNIKGKPDMLLFYYFGEISYNEHERGGAVLRLKGGNISSEYELSSSELYQIVSDADAKFNNLVIIGKSSNEFCQKFDPHFGYITSTTSSDYWAFKPQEEHLLAFADTWVYCQNKNEGQDFQVADADSNGYVTMEEAFNYTKSSLKELYNGNFPYIVSNTKDLKGKLAINHIPTTSWPIIRDNEEDVGNEPNNSNIIVWNSPDIWLRNQNDGLTNQESEHIKENDVYVYVRLSHNGGEVADKDAKRNVNLLWSIKHLGEREVSTYMGPPEGSFIAELHYTDELKLNDSTILCYQWTLPEELQKRISNNGNVLDVDIAAVITKEDEFAWYKYLDFHKHSTSACKAVTVVDPTLGTKYSNEDSPTQISKDGVTIPVVVYNGSSYAQTYNIKAIRDNSATGRSAFDFSEITMYLGNSIYQSWVSNGKNGTDIKNYSGEPQRVYLKSPNSSINGIELPPNSCDTILMTIQAYSGATSAFKLDDTFHLTLTNNENKIIGGTGFRVLINGSGSDIGEPIIGEIDPGIGSLGTLTAKNISQQTACRWMDKDHNTLGTGNSLTIDLGKDRKEYILKVTSTIDNSVVYAYTEPIGIQISGISPNPCSSQICISTNVPTSSGTVISITNIDGAWHKDIPVKEGETQIEVSTADFPAGRYFVSLIVDGNVISNKQIVKL